MAIAIARESPDQPDVLELLRLSDEYNLARYPRESCHGLPLEELIEQKVRFFVVRDDRRAIGCGGFACGRDGTGELKRMFVLEAERGRGLGRLLLERIESEAAAEGIQLLQLETGSQSHGGIALYSGAGYRVRGPFGCYREDPHCLYMEKELSSPLPATDPALKSVLAELVAREPIFHRPEGGTSRRDNELMTAPDFWEVGASGRRYSREHVLDELDRRRAAAHEAQWETSDFRCRQLAPDVFLLTYALAQGSRVTRRSTIWQRTPSGWQIIYHQGTVVED